MSELPKGWGSAPIAAVCSIIRGVTYNKSQSTNIPQEGYAPILRANNIQAGKILPSDLVYVPSDCVSNFQKIRKGDIVVAMSSGSKSVVGKTAFAESDWHGAFGAFCGVLRPALEINGKYIYYFTQTAEYRTRASSLSAGANINNLKPAHFEEIEIPIAPLSEQTRIAQKLDELLAQVDTLKARIDAIPALLKRFRQSVLAAAVSGRLTEEWRASLETYTHPDGDDWKWPPIPQSWQVKRYPEIVESRLGKMLDKAKNTGNLTKYLGNINVRWFDFNLTDVQEIRVSDTEREELTIKKGDVLICEGGEPGRCAIWDDRVDDQIIFQKAIHRARVTEVLMPEWLAFNLKHDAESMVLEQLFTGTTIKHLTGKALNKYPLRIPPLTEQTEIVRRVEQLFAFADQLEAKVATAKARIDRLTQSILAKAFRGELVPQDPNDEPASVLLERIQAQRAAAPRARRGRKATA